METSGRAVVLFLLMMIPFRDNCKSSAECLAIQL